MIRAYTPKEVQFQRGQSIRQAMDIAIKVINARMVKDITSDGRVYLNTQALLNEISQAGLPRSTFFSLGLDRYLPVAYAKSGWNMKIAAPNTSDVWTFVPLESSQTEVIKKTSETIDALLMAAARDPEVVGVTLKPDGTVRRRFSVGVKKKNEPRTRRRQSGIPATVTERAKNGTTRLAPKRKKTPR